MANYTKQKLSGSTDGRAIKITSTTAATTVHTSVSGTTDFDEVWLYATNSSTSNVKLTVQFGGTSSPDDEIETTINAESGLTLVIPGLVLQNAAVVRAFAATANVINVSGYVNRIDN
jgi:hypothetical protein